ncbi:MAG: YdeI/OmpD-associated family protein [Kiritimatiellaeota bacterium]|nr:YdeI/OmpD-associated family protein [Kiritimatiellota bacterium]
MFPSRGDFRAWLDENAETSDGVWLIFGKAKAVVTLTANDALEEALCFGWIDGQMKSIDSAKYLKYFARRRVKSIWAEKNKKTVEALREKGLMTGSGEKAVETAKKNGMWDARTAAGEREQLKAFAEKLSGFSPAYENFMKLPTSAKLAKMRWYQSFKTEANRQRTFENIVEELNRMYYSVSD